MGVSVFLIYTYLWGYSALPLTPHMFSRANANAIIAAFWANLEIFRDPALLSKIRHSIRSSVDSSVQSNLRFDIEKLIRQPLLQSVYAETLRLRVHVYITRCSERKISISTTGLSPKTRLFSSLLPRHIWTKVPGTAVEMDPNLSPSSGPSVSSYTQMILIAGPRRKPLTRHKLGILQSIGRKRTRRKVMPNLNFL